MNSVLDILVIAAHPDDAELCCGGTILKHISAGLSVGVLDLTQGELGTRGSATLRLEESKLATQMMGLSMRANLGLRDGYFINDETTRAKVIAYIRHYRPKIVLANAIEDRHPDHERAALVAKESCFYAGLRKIETFWDHSTDLTFEDSKTDSSQKVCQEPWRPSAVYHYVQDRYLNPSFVVDISEFMERKLNVLKAFSSQFYDPESKEPISYISTPDFMESIIARAREVGKPIGAKFGEGFHSDRLIGVENLFNLK